MEADNKKRQKPKENGDIKKKVQPSRSLHTHPRSPNTPHGSSPDIGQPKVDQSRLPKPEPSKAKKRKDYEPTKEAEEDDDENEGDEDSDQPEELLGDDDMAAYDAKLVEMFKEMKNQKSKTKGRWRTSCYQKLVLTISVSEVKQSVLHFKFRVLDMLKVSLLSHATYHQKTERALFFLFIIRVLSRSSQAVRWCMG